MEIDKLRSQQLDELFDAFLALETREECYRFFDDIATMNEMQSMSARLQVASMLLAGNTYQAIEKKTNASTATISRVQRVLNRGNGGYRLALERVQGKGGGA